MKTYKRDEKKKTCVEKDKIQSSKQKRDNNKKIPYNKNINNNTKYQIISTIYNFLTFLFIT